MEATGRRVIGHLDDLTHCVFRTNHVQETRFFPRWVDNPSPL